MGFLEAARAPVLNDVATDLEDPPAFIAARQAPLPEAWKPLIAKAYPDLKPLRVKLEPAASSSPTPASPEAVLDAVTTAAKSMPRWQVVAVGPGLVVEAVSTTALLRFKDDVIIRIKPEQPAPAGEGAAQGQEEGVLRVDMRSRSRVGKGDLGANAARIRAFLARLREELAKRGLSVL